MSDTEGVVYATGTASLMVNGAQVLVEQGSHWLRGDAVVRAHPQWFSSDYRYGLSWTGDMPEMLNEPPIEETTARPGERRNVVRRG